MNNILPDDVTQLQQEAFEQSYSPVSPMKSLMAWFIVIIFCLLFAVFIVTMMHRSAFEVQPDFEVLDDLTSSL
jgi:hypothetical protein